MGFKVNTSFLRFLSMGAVGVRATINHMRLAGYEPIELERYCASNKIWMTKVKRLRLPDLLCVRTGLRIEVRAKSDLKIRMSDAPNNPDRRWDVGLRDNDLVAFIACDTSGEQIEPLGPPVLVEVSDLRATVDKTTLGPPKSASEGAERDREWKTTVPKKDGEVLEVTAAKIVTQLATRKQSYQLKGKTPYVSTGDKFIGGATIIAGHIHRLIRLSSPQSPEWNPIELLDASDPVDRYAAAKAIPYRAQGTPSALQALLARLETEDDARVALELAASAARLGSDTGLENIFSTAEEHDRADIQMEAILILSELGTSQAAECLKTLAASDGFKATELQQAAVWGLGRTGCKSYNDLVAFIGDADAAVALHAIAGFGPDTSAGVVRNLIAALVSNAGRQRAAASEVLRLIGSEAVLQELIAAAKSHEDANPWLLATLGRLDPQVVRKALRGDPLLALVEPMFTLHSSENWLAEAETAEDLRFLLGQNIG